MATKTEIFREHITAYLKESRAEKGVILERVCGVTGMHRKAAIRKFRKLQLRDGAHQEQRGRSVFYTPDVTAALRTVWEAGNEVCGELLHPMIREYVTTLERDGLWRHNASATDKLLFMSEGTVRRRVGAFQKARKSRKGVGTTKPSHLKHTIPIFTGPWKAKPPGYGQIDTVVHSDSAAGDAVYTLNYTDAASLLVIPRAQWNKGQEATRESMKTIKSRLPFPWLGAHPDTGSEFINRFVIDWCREATIDLTRSRPGHKNDNMYVEERNGHVIRRTVGYMRLNCPEAVNALNTVYDALTPYLMHFVAVRRMTGKEKQGSKYRRTYEKTPKTPYQRILEHKAVAAPVKERLHSEHATLNPLVLKREIDKRVETLYAVQKRCGNPR